MSKNSKKIYKNKQNKNTKIFLVFFIKIATIPLFANVCEF